MKGTPTRRSGSGSRPNRHANAGDPPGSNVVPPTLRSAMARSGHRIGSISGFSDRVDASTGTRAAGTLLMVTRQVIQ